MIHRICNAYLFFIVALGRGAAAWGALLFVAWWIAYSQGSMIVVTTTPSLENTVFMMERLSDYSYPHQHQRGQIMAVCLNKEQAAIARLNELPPKEGFASRWLGCEHGAWLKRIMGTPGDTVSVAGGVIRINGLSVSAMPQITKKGIPADVYPHVSHVDSQIVLGLDEYYMLGDHNLSFDSRYVGVIAGNQIKGIVKRAM